MENAVAKEFKEGLQVKLTAYSLLKLFMRGIDDVQAVARLQSELNQCAIGTRTTVRVGDICLVGERTSAVSGTIVTGWKVGEEGVNVAEKGRELQNMMYDIIVGPRLTAWDIRKGA